jgi:TonB-dependent starch-binding outer membrane protein SusC
MKIHFRPFAIRSRRVRATWLRALSCTAALAIVNILPAQAQNTGTITGQVTDATTRAPIAQAQVYLQGTGLGTVTNPSGRYIITNVPAGEYTVRVERLGMQTITERVRVAAGESVEVNFTLQTQALGLDEIVVTGTAGAARRREVGNTISQIDMGNVNEPPVNMDALLQSRVVGMTVTPGSGSMGSGSQIRLRGNVSVAMSNQPIVYVDGVRVRSDGYAKNVPNTGFQSRSNNDHASPFNDINPADIERIEVIKGAAATTLYGTEAAAGVIQIFTKRGRPGAPQWTFQIDQGMARVLPFGPSTSDRPPSQPERTSAGGRSEYLFIDPWLRNAWQQRYSVSVGGGRDDFQYFVSGTLTDNEGVLPNDHEDKTNLRGNFAFSPTTNLQLQWNTSFTNTELSHTAVGNNAHGLTLNAFRRDRNYASSEDREDIDPLLNQELTTKLEHLVTGATAIWSPLDALTNRLTVGYDLAQQNNRNLRPFGFALAPEGILSDRRHRFSTLTADYVGTYNLRMTEDIRTALSWGGQAVQTETEETGAYGENFPGPGQPVVDAAGTTLGFESRQRVINAGFFGQALFDLRDRYFLTLGLRVDGNSAFGENLGLQTYPKASFSWVTSDESFWNPSWGELKLRAAYGHSGRAPGAFDAVRTYNPVGWGQDPAFFPLNVGNPDLGPERTAELEFGFDGSFLDDRLGVVFTRYDAKTTDALFEVRQIPSQGFLGSQLENVGELRNSGIELNVLATVIRHPSFSWEVGGNLATVKSEIVSLGGAPAFSLGDFGWIVEGAPVPVIRAQCVVNRGELAAPVYENECEYGPANPTRIIGGSTTLSLPHGMQINLRGEYQSGHYIYDLAAFNAVTRSVIWAGCYNVYSIVETQGVDFVPAEERARCLLPTRADHHIYPADFFKLRELTFHAPIPDRLFPGPGRASFTLSGRNFWRWTKDEFRTFDPEMSNNSGFEATVRSISEHVPAPSVWTASIRVNF